MKAVDWVIGLLVSLAFVGVAVFTIHIHNMRMAKGCTTFEDWRISDVPARCYNHFHFAR